jgi:hypothetical protein
MIDIRWNNAGARKGLVAALALAAIASVALAQPLATPTRRAGWWEQSMTMNMRGKEQTMTTQMCTDPQIERESSVIAQAAGGQSCSRRDITPVPGGWHVVSECSSRFGGSRTTTGMVTGDFQSHLHMDLVSQSARGSDHVVMDTRWLGACPAGRRPGDVVMPGGQVMNVTEMMAH